MGDNGRCFDRAPHLHKAASIPQEFLGDEGTEYTPWMQKPRLTIFQVAVMADLAARRQIPVPQSSKSEIHMRLTVFSFSSLQPFRRHQFSQSTPRLAGSSLNKLQYPKAHFALYFFQRPFSNLLPTWLRRRANLEAESHTIDLIPQDLVSTHVLRKCSIKRCGT